MKTTTLISGLIGGSTLIFCGFSASAAQLTVPSSEYPTLQSAVDGSVNGDDIYVLPGTYTEQVTLVDRELNFFGSPDSVIRAPAGLLGGIVVLDGGNLTLHDLTIDGAGWGSSAAFYGIEVLSGFVYLDGVTVRDVSPPNAGAAQTGHGIYAAPLDEGDEILVVVSNSFLRGYQKNGILARGSNTAVQVTSSEFDGGGGNSLVARNAVALQSVQSAILSDSHIVNHLYLNTDYTASGVYAGNVLNFQVSNSTFENNQTAIYQRDVMTSSIQGNTLIGGDTSSDFGIISFQTVSNAGTSVISNLVRAMDYGMYIGGVAHSFVARRNTLICSPIVDDTGSATLRLNHSVCPGR